MTLNNIYVHIGDDVKEVKKLDREHDKTTDPVKKQALAEQIAKTREKIMAVLDDRKKTLEMKKLDFLDNHPDGEDRPKFKAMNRRLEFIDKRKERIDKKLND